MKILVADDDFTSRRSLVRILTKLGHRPIEAADGGQALDLMRQDDAPQLAIIDWMMPVLKGPEVCRRLRDVSADCSPYLLILTSRDSKADIVAGLEAGANDYITKPFDGRELQARVGVGCRLIGLQNKMLRSRQTLVYQAHHDPLTGLFNRRAILDRLTKELSRVRSVGGELIIGIIDIDHFKQINDRYGHQIGDEVLKNFARKLKENVREDDAIGRWGGEEFLVIIPIHADRDEWVIHDRLSDKLGTSLVSSSIGELNVTASIGCVRVDELADIDTLLNVADKALYRAKALGRNRLVWARNEEISLKCG